MPILDLQAKVQNNKFMYKFFKKEVSNPRVILASSAMPMKVKRNALVQEGIRRLKNTSRNIPWSEKAEILTEFSNAMRISGYSEQFRLEIFKSAVTGYQRMCAQADAGIRPLHRKRDWSPEERRRKKLLSNTSWYRPADAVGFFPATPNRELATTIQNITKEEGKRIGMDNGH